MKSDFKKDRVIFSMTHGEVLDICKTLIAYKELVRKQNQTTPCWNFILAVREWLDGEMILTTQENKIKDQNESQDIKK